MKNKLLLIIALCWCTYGFGQISGTKHIPSASYGTIAIAIDSLNTYGVGAGGVTFFVFYGYSEDITAPLLLTATGSAGSPIVFMTDFAPPLESPLSNPLVRRTDPGAISTTALEAQGDAVIIIQGGDYITFDGIDVQATNEGIEYGYFLRRASTDDGCKSVTITNSAITMNKGTSPYVIGIYSSNLDINSPASSGVGITVSSTGGRTENLVITGNTISNVLGGIAIRGYNHASPFTYMDQNNVIGVQGSGNIIRNFGGTVTTTCFAVHLYYQTSPDISYNTINNVAGGGTDAMGAIYGIWHQLSNNVGNFVASNNNFTFGENAAAGGVYFIQATPAGQPENSISIQNNTFAFGTFNCTGSSLFISCSGARANNITVTGNSTIGSIEKTGASGSVTCYTNTGGGASTGGIQLISNNVFSNILIGGTGVFTGIEARSNTNLLQSVAITNNTISNNTAGGSNRAIYQSGGAAGSTVNNNIIADLVNTGLGSGAINNVVTGIMLGSNSAPVNLSCYDNTISGLKGAEPVYGLWNQSGANNNIFRNSIFNLRSNTTGIGPVYGMIINGGVTTNIYNNFISDLVSPYASGDFVIMGVYIAGGTAVNMYNNTIYLNATTSGTAFGTTGIYAKTATTLELRNNIVVNKSEHVGNTGFTVAYRRFDNILFSYSNVSDNNDFYASSSLPYGNYIYCEGSSSTPVTAKDSTMADYKARVTPRDAASFSENPPFINGSTVPYDLHLLTSVSSTCESGGVRVTSPISVTNDWDGDLRWGEPGYSGSGTSTDVGADEFGTLLMNGLVANAACPTGNEGAIDITLSGGNNPFTYLWSNSATTQDLTGLAPGSYAVTVTDATNIAATGSWTVGFADPICDNSTVSGTVSNTQCYNAYLTLTVSGLAVTAPDGHVELIAGQNIMIMPGTTVQEGAWLWGHISTTYCSQPPPMVATGTGQEEQPAGISAAWFSLYPNPTNGNFTLVQKGDRTDVNVKIEVFNMNGSRMLTGQMIGEKRHEVATSSLPAGIYFVKLIADDHVETIKLIKTR